MHRIMLVIAKMPKLNLKNIDDFSLKTKKSSYTFSYTLNTK